GAWKENNGELRLPPSQRPVCAVSGSAADFHEPPLGRKLAGGGAAARGVEFGNGAVLRLRGVARINRQQQSRRSFAQPRGGLCRAGFAGAEAILADAVRARGGLSEMVGGVHAVDRGRRMAVAQFEGTRLSQPGLSRAELYRSLLS